MSLIILEKQSLKLIKGLFDERRENIIQFSGGKDSIVLYHLAKMSGLNFSYTYQNTTWDRIDWIAEHVQERKFLYEIEEKDFIKSIQTIAKFHGAVS